MRTLNTEIAILGGGPVGYVTALRATQLGAEVTLIEENTLGGVCLNVACIPTKTLLSTSHIFAGIYSAKEHGIYCELEGIDWAKAVARKDRAVRSLGIGLEQLLQARKNTVASGSG
ncbi:MAG: FAD-dependent oxidoreductase [Symbiobacteriaceae bacterium]|nr:FAD-dependent oxidoreductase [Symbiobacteriaceae bacterium]